MDTLSEIPSLARDVIIECDEGKVVVISKDNPMIHTSMIKNFNETFHDNVPIPLNDMSTHQVREVSCIYKSRLCDVKRMFSEKVSFIMRTPNPEFTTNLKYYFALYEKCHKYEFDRMCNVFVGTWLSYFQLALSPVPLLSLEDDTPPDFNKATLIMEQHASIHMIRELFDQLLKHDRINYQVAVRLTQVDRIKKVFIENSFIPKFANACNDSMIHIIGLHTRSNFNDFYFRHVTYYNSPILLEQQKQVEQSLHEIKTKLREFENYKLYFINLQYGGIKIKNSLSCGEFIMIYHNPLIESLSDGSVQDDGP